MQFKTGMIVKSNAGHDKDRYYVLVNYESGCGYIADGKRRKLEKPKRKNLIHLSPTDQILEMTVLDTDKKIRRVLLGYNYGDQTISVAD